MNGKGNTYEHSNDHLYGDLCGNAGSLTAFLTPMATPAVPMCMADGGYDLKSLFKCGALITLILPFIYIFYTMTVFPAF